MVRTKQRAGSQFAAYRHFAVITVVLTAAVAIFSDGARREAIADEIAEREQRAQLAQASEAKFGKPKLVRKKAPGGGSFGPDTGDFGEPMDDTGGGDSGYIPASSAPHHAPAAYNRYGLTEEQWAALSESEREAIRGQARRDAALAASPQRPREIDRLRAASARRSGTHETGEFGIPD